MEKIKNIWSFIKKSVAKTIEAKMSLNWPLVY